MEMANSEPMKYVPTSVVRITKSQAAELSIGEKVSLQLSGEIQALRKSDDYYEAEIKGASVNGIEINKADRAMNEMTGTDKAIKSAADKIVKAIAKTPADHSLDRINYGK